MLTVARVTVRSNVFLPSLHGQAHLGARRALDPRDAGLLRDALQRLAVDLDDEVAVLQAGARRRRLVVDPRDPQALVDAHDAEADAREAALGDLLVALVLGGREVVGELVAERRDHALDRGVGQLALGHLVDVVVLDEVVRVGDDLRLLVDEDAADEPGQVLGLRAEPDPHDEQDRREHRQGESEWPRPVEAPHVRPQGRRASSAPDKRPAVCVRRAGSGAATGPSRRRRRPRSQPAGP